MIYTGYENRPFSELEAEVERRADPTALALLEHIAEKDQEISDRGREIEALKERIEEMENDDIGALRAQLNELQEAIATRKRQLAQAQHRAQQAEERLSVAEAKFNAELAAMQKKLADMPASVW